MKTFNGKAIRNPDGKAGEYAYFATDAYFGCKNNCTYCYLKKGVWKHLWCTTPKLLKKFRDLNHATSCFLCDLREILESKLCDTVRKYGIFLNFESDPFLPETISYTQYVFATCVYYHVPVVFLTKRADFIEKYILKSGNDWLISSTKITRNNAAFGFTLTGHDELEPNASTNAERIRAMRKLHGAGLKTWASIEPVIDFESSLEMIKSTMEICDLYKIGLESGKKYDKHDINVFIQRCFKYAHLRSLKVYFKDSLLKQAGVSRSDLPDNCVDRNYNLFEDRLI
jgi:DNA repair photolyase